MPQSYLKKWREDKTELLLCKTIPYFCSLILNQIFFLPISTLKNGGGGGGVYAQENFPQILPYSTAFQVQNTYT